MPIIVESFSLAIIGYLGLMRLTGQSSLPEILTRQMTCISTCTSEMKIMAHAIHATDYELSDWEHLRRGWLLYFQGRR